jgi:hypothetical protein
MHMDLSLLRFFLSCCKQMLAIVSSRRSFPFAALLIHEECIIIGWIIQTIFHCAAASSMLGPPNCRGFTVTLRHTTLDRTPLYEWSETCTWQHTTLTTMPPPGFEPALPASERPQTRTSDRVVAGSAEAYRTSLNKLRIKKKKKNCGY